jgi:ABC-type nickel/cobalt efflux system permease component RcnA
MGIEHKHQHEHEHEHGHHQGPPRRKLHHDWRVWLVVGLMLTAMLVYVLSDNERFGFGRASQSRPPVPAMAP